MHTYSIFIFYFFIYLKYFLRSFSKIKLKIFSKMIPPKSRKVAVLGSRSVGLLFFLFLISNNILGKSSLTIQFVEGVT